MAKVDQGILGGFRGSIGNIVGASWKGINYMRTKALSVANPRTAGQVTQRSKFSDTVALAQEILATIIKPMWDRFAVKMSGYNDFVGTNTEFMTAIGGRDFSKLIMSKGKMAFTALSGLVLGAGESQVEYTWLDDSGTGFKLATDEAFAVVWNETQGVVSSGDIGAVRSDGAGNPQTSSEQVGGDVIHTWLMFRRLDGTIVGDSFYQTGVAA